MQDEVRTRGRVAVVGGGAAPEEVLAAAEAVGEGLARLGVVLVTGGLGGVMEAACRGYARAGGPLAVGILPGEDRDAANPHVDLAVATGLGHARNLLVAMNGDVVVALPGAGGTLSEVGFAGVLDRPVVALSPGPGVGLEGVREADDVAQLVATVAELLDG